MSVPGRSVSPGRCVPACCGGSCCDPRVARRRGSRALLVAVPVGLINTSWGGTRSEAWTSMPTLAAECSLDLGCPPELFSPFCDAHPERTVVVYANTCAAVKARADWVVTSSIAVDVVIYACCDARIDRICAFLFAHHPIPVST